MTGPANNLCHADGARSATYSISPVSGATSYTWTVPTGMNITNNSGTSISVSINGNFTGGNVCVSASNTCGASPSRCLITTAKPAIPGLITGSSSVCKTAASEAYSVANVTGAAFYYWSASNGAVPSISNTNSVTVNYNYATSTTAAVAVSVANGCGTTSPSRKIVSVNLLCKEELYAEGLIAYPNPANENTTISFTGKSEGLATLEVSNVLGETLRKYEVVVQRGRNEFNVSTGTLSPGLYLITVKTPDGTASSIRLTVN